jgi:hypothetical protein
MSSPIANKTHKSNFFHKIIIKLHRRISHKNRVEILSQKLMVYCHEIVDCKTDVKCLDVGCGDLGIMNNLSSVVAGTTWEGLDIYDLPENLRRNKKWINYKKFNGKDLPYEDDTIDIVLFCDMLHHDSKNMYPLLSDAKRVGKFIIIKDSFEYSIYSRVMLKIMDFIGNWGYGVPLPDKYFTIDTFKLLCNKLNLQIRKLDIGIQIYDHLPIIRNILRPKWHFIAVLEKSLKTD